jgi:hypothetical protein
VPYCGCRLRSCNTRRRHGRAKRFIRWILRWRTASAQHGCIVSWRRRMGGQSAPRTNFATQQRGRQDRGVVVRAARRQRRRDRRSSHVGIGVAQHRGVEGRVVSPKLGRAFHPTSRWHARPGGGCGRQSSSSSRLLVPEGVVVELEGPPVGLGAAELALGPVQVGSAELDQPSSLQDPLPVPLVLHLEPTPHHLEHRLH